ncbi:MAG: hypothetical protein ABR555_03445 [Pyrinomonadaceae bacterium]
MNYYSNNDEVSAVVQGFESCTITAADFNHPEHLTVAVAYLRNGTTEAAVCKMRDSLLRFLDHHAVDQRKYNETVTVFWIEMVAQELNRFDNHIALFEACNRINASLKDSKLASRYYSDELLSSEEARLSFVAPDLREWRSAVSE